MNWETKVVIANDFEPEPLAEVTYHAGGRFIRSSQDRPIREQAARAVCVRAEPNIRFGKLLRDNVLTYRTDTRPVYALVRAQAAALGLRAVSWKGAAQPVCAPQVLEARCAGIALGRVSPMD